MRGIFFKFMVLGIAVGISSAEAALPKQKLASKETMQKHLLFTRTPQNDIRAFWLSIEAPRKNLEIQPIQESTDPRVLELVRLNWREIKKMKRGTRGLAYRQAKLNTIAENQMRNSFNRLVRANIREYELLGIRPGGMEPREYFESQADEYIAQHRKLLNEANAFRPENNEFLIVQSIDPEEAQVSIRKVSDWVRAQLENRLATIVEQNRKLRGSEIASTKKKIKQLEENQQSGPLGIAKRQAIELELLELRTQLAYGKRETMVIASSSAKPTQ